jgi:hypothetical protein
LLTCDAPRRAAITPASCAPPPPLRRGRRKKPPAYGDRVYDTLRAEPNAVERRLFAKAWQRRPLMNREAARIVARGPIGERQNLVEVGPRRR